MYAADAALIVLDAVSGVEVQTERVWKFAAEFGRPVIFVVNRMDRERASFDRVIEAMKKKFGHGVIALQIPVGEEKAFHGTVDLARMEIHVHEGGKRVDGPIPPSSPSARRRSTTRSSRRWPRAKTTSWRSSSRRARSSRRTSCRG